MARFQTFFNTIGIDTRLHTLQKNMKIKVIVVDSCTACLTFCTENQAPYLLKNNNNEIFKLTPSTRSMLNDMLSKTSLLWLQLKARRYPTMNYHLSHFKCVHTAMVKSTGDWFINQRVHKNKSYLYESLVQVLSFKLGY